MPDLIIRGMEMPQRCKACRFCGFGGRRSELNVCMFTGESQPKLSQERMSKCPLVPLPAGHGRLGDLDRLFEVMGQDADRWIVDEVSMIETDDVLDAIQNAPTIVPAEGCLTMASDLIYREDAKVFVRHACYKKINPIDYLDEVPAADVRPVVHGEWLMPNADKTDRPMPECSVCGWYVAEEAAMEFTFCPTCGADMREPNLDTTKGDNHD